MAQNNCQKIKLLKLMEMLRQETDEQHPMKADEICKRLVEMGISCDIKTFRRDIRTLNEFGFEVMSFRIGHEKAYYVAERSFSVPELKILIDAIQAASFVTDKKTEELIEKIAYLGGSHRADILKSNIVNFNTRKHRNEAIYYSVDCLENAIEQNKKVIFRYFDLDENGEKVYRRDGRHYVVEPIALVFNEDNYYLVSYSSKHDNIASYRVDRMDAVEIIDESICEQAQELRNSVAGYTEHAFKMYGGQAEDLTLKFSNSLIGVVYDKFGEDIKMIRLTEDTCAANVKVRISPTFWGWLFQFGRQMEILSPGYVAEEYQKQINNVMSKKGNAAQ